MIRNYLLITWRNITRRLGFTSLNILGLSIGLAASLIILQYVKDELSYDTFQEHGENIYRVRYDFYRDGEQIFKCATAFPKVAPMLKQDFPEVEDATRLFLHYGGGVVRYGEVSIKEDNIFQAEQNFFSIFSYPIIEGVAKLDQPNTALIEKETAKKFFGEESPVGKQIKFGNNQEYEVTGVVESPENSHLKFTFLFSYPTLVTLWGEDFNTAWGWYDFYNYVLVKPGTDVAALEAKLPAFIEKYGGEGNSDRTRFVLQPLLDIHLYSDLIQEARVNGNGQAVYFLMIIAFFILVIAWVNYINLATARAVERAKEVGIRKSIGAAKRQLVGQFIGEAFLVNLLAAVLGLGLVYTSVPLFNEIAGKSLTHSIFLDRNLWLALGGLYFVGSIFSGLYPALVLSSFSPAKVLKGSMKGSREGLFLRKGLVILQFGVSIFLIAGTLIVYNQMQYMQNQDLGIDIDQTLVVNGPNVFSVDSLWRPTLDGFRNEMREHSSIASFTAASEIPGNLIYWTNGARKLGEESTVSTIMYRMGIDYEYFNTFGSEIIAGRGYSKEFTADSASVILNRKAIEVLALGGPEEAIGQKVRIGGDTLTVVGVVENFHQEGLKQDFRQTAFSLQPANGNYFCLKVNPENVGETIAYVRDKYQASFPENPFDYFFLDTFFNTQYKSEQQFGKVFGFFSLLAIFVASLGLFGLASYTATQRTKEIGIRKVLGSSVPAIFVLLSKDFLKLVLVSNVIAIPIVWYLMDKWLSGFAFRIEIGIGVFIVAACITALIALITVSYQSITAAVTNPVKSLRYE